MTADERTLEVLARRWSLWGCRTLPDETRTGSGSLRRPLGVGLAGIDKSVHTDIGTDPAEGTPYTLFSATVSLVVTRGSHARCWRRRQVRKTPGAAVTNSSESMFA